MDRRSDTPHGEGIFDVAKLERWKNQYDYRSSITKKEWEILLLLAEIGLRAPLKSASSEKSAPGEVSGEVCMTQAVYEEFLGYRAECLLRKSAQTECSECGQKDTSTSCGATNCPCPVSATRAMPSTEDVEKAMADAARYRYLKDNRRLLNITIEAFYPGKKTVNGAEADGLIDWYMKEYPLHV